MTTSGPTTRALMRPDDGPAPPSGRWDRVRHPRVGALLSVLLLAALASAAAGLTLWFKHAGERAIEGELALSGVVAELRLQDGLEWRAISGRAAPATVRPELVESAERARAVSADAVRNGLPASRGERLTSMQEGYLSVLGQELALLTAGRVSEAEEFDEAQVDPRFEAVIEELDRQTGWLRWHAERAQLVGDAGVLVTVLVSLGSTVLIQRRRVRADVQRREEQRLGARYRALVNHSADLVMVLGFGGRMRYLSPSAERFIRDDLALDPVRVELTDLLHPDDRDSVLAALSARSGQPETGATAQARLGRGPARWRHFELSIQDLSQEPSVGGTVLTAHDVTERQAMQQEMAHQATHDALTGLPNRRLLGTRLDHCLRADVSDRAATGLLLIDLDRFKEINDTLGHHVGDEVLTQVGLRLAGAVREADTVARLGGDEFAILLPGVGTVSDAVAVAESLLSALKAPFQMEQLTLHVEASIGVVVSGVHGLDTATLQQRADVAMYLAKHAGLGVSVYDPAADGHSPQRLALLADLRRGLDDELMLHYQPQISMLDGTVCGAEALVRWNHPTQGMLAPDAFIPAAEHSGLIGPLTHRVLNLALAQAGRWLSAGQPLQISVNLSARSLLDESLDGEIAELLRVHQVPAELLTLEITESAIMIEPARAAQILHRLRALGAQISIDDFGAGYTSLAQLKDLPIDELKIDRSFVMAMADDRSSQLIVHSVIDLGHNLGFRTVAEGVETAHALTTLAGYGCDIAQGYHLSRPIPADEFDQWRADPKRHPVVPTLLTAER